MANDYFTASEAQALIGRRFQANPKGPGYSGVPEGTVGTVTSVYPVDRRRGLYGVDVTWEGIRGGSPHDQARGGLTDGFSRSDLEARFNPEVPGCGGERAMLPYDGPGGIPVPAPGFLGYARPVGARRLTNQRDSAAEARSASCHRCHRGLKDPESQRRGYGPVCAGKVAAGDRRAEERARRQQEATPDA